MSTRPGPRKDTHHIDKRAHLIANASKSGADDLLTTIEVAAWIGVSVQFLEIGRGKGYGPRFKKISPRCVRYLRSDVLDWLKSRTHACTAEYRSAEVA